MHDTIEAVRQDAAEFRQTFEAIRREVGKMIVGQEGVINGVLTALMAGGHVLLEGVPGLGKTMLVSSISRAVDLPFSRIQFTPDMMPADIIGTSMLTEAEGGGHVLSFQEGPIVSNLVLADEINRATPKTQSALLEVMQERQVTVGRRTIRMPEPFCVMATQNPVDQEGTYPLPEAQMDRFLMHVSVGYPQADAEAQIIRLARAEEDDGATANRPGDGADARLSPEVIFAARQAIHGVTVSEPVERYIVTLVQATRDAGRFDDDLKRWVQVGVSPRGSIGLDKVARAIAWLRGRDHVTPEDVQAVVHDVFRHRLILSYEAHAAAVAADAVIDRLLERVAVA